MYPYHASFGVTFAKEKLRSVETAATELFVAHLGGFTFDGRKGFWLLDRHSDDVALVGGRGVLVRGEAGVGW